MSDRSLEDKIVESIPNISEGRNREIVESIVDEVRNTEGCILMNYSSDKDHNRSVISYIGSPKAVEKASFRLMKKALKLIDLRKHKGEHPRMGAVDVMPIVPIKNISMEECIEISKRIGEKVARELAVPVYLYEKSSKTPERARLEVIRRGEFENLDEKLKDEKWYPDFGKNIKHESAGALILGARNPLIAYNVLLNTSDVEIAKQISKDIRESGGGMKSVKAIGIYIADRNLAQVSMNLTDYRETSLFDVMEGIKLECKKYGVEIYSTELIGMMPMEAFVRSAASYLKIENFNYDNQVIENFLI